MNQKGGMSLVKIGVYHFSKFPNLLFDRVVV